MSAREELAELVGANAAYGLRCGCFEAVLAAGWRPPARTVSTVEELEALPSGTVIRSSAGTIACRYDADRGVVFGDVRPFVWVMVALPVTVLFEGGA